MKYIFIILLATVAPSLMATGSNRTKCLGYAKCGNIRGKNKPMNPKFDQRKKAELLKAKFKPKKNR